jgi:hypothetical protein
MCQVESIQDFNKNESKIQKGLQSMKKKSLENDT